MPAGNAIGERCDDRASDGGADAGDRGGGDCVSGEVTGLELMERAGRGVVEAIFEEWPELAEAGEAGGFRPRTPEDI